MFIKMKNEIDGESKSEKAAEDSTTKPRESRKAQENPLSSTIQTPFSVKAVITRIEQAQLHRAKEDITMQLNDIMNNVQRILNRYSIEQNLLSGNRASFLEYKKKRRANFLENIATYTQIVEVREKTLTNILAWLEEWNAILSEMTTMDVNEYHHWIVQMEILPETFKAIESNVKMLIKISTALFEEKKKQRKN